ncbi:GrBNV gp35-like protein-like protein [Mauternbach virus]|uniref:GrBNV gp35-like protein-like protein n=1 Tax=Mauternbach virus TaxID=2486603 RepID=A0A3G3E783_9VIRU|nr:GrBNV gp35-like protein-like protein [Mauternbach virus]AYP97951.1 GrBNV gp35-like protein-like protein [Mauternbach virus]
MLSIEKKRYNDTELYVNLMPETKYKYPREFRTDIDSEKRQIVVNRFGAIWISITSIPDCVSPEANEAIIPIGEYKRLYIFSDIELDEAILIDLDGFYGREPYPIFKCDKIIATLERYPLTNFYMVHGTPMSTSTFVEYRYIKQRHIISNLAYNSLTGDVYNIMLPRQSLMVLIMPDNFIRLGLKHGYFHFENNIIVRVYSKYLLSSRLEKFEDPREITVFSADNSRIKTIVERFFNRLGIHKIVSNDDNQIYGYDKYITLVVGNLSNVVMP